MNENLKHIFANVNSWLTYEEAKHAGLIGLNSATIFGIFGIYNLYSTKIPAVIVLISVILFGLSLITSFISWFPHLKGKVEDKKTDNPATLNLYFFKDLAKLGKEDFLDALHETDNSFSPDRLEGDIMQEILINSRIVLFKSTLFRIALVITALGFVIPLAAVFIKLVS
jgi:TM2 domain-containing membrane protein YozV